MTTGQEQADPLLTEIIRKYRAVGTAYTTYRQLQRDLAVLFSQLNHEQQQAYVAATERIDDEERKEQETRHG